MPLHLTRIDPTLPLCWEDADTLRVGFEYADARIRAPSAGVQRLVGALRTGVLDGELRRAARRLGATPQEARELLTTLAPVLRREIEHGADAGPPADRDSEGEPNEPRVRVGLGDDGRPAAGFDAALRAAGVCDVVEGSTADSLDLVVLLERYLEPLERAQRWLSVDQPHLIVAFTDRAIRVGPLVSGAGAPCHTCTSLAALDRDPALAILAAQLAGSRPSTETAAGVHAAAAWAAVFIRNWAAGDPVVRTSRATIPCIRGRPVGTISMESVAAHPECACSAATPRSRPLR